MYLGYRQIFRERAIMKYGLLWLLGVPIPVLIVLYLIFQ
jgi:hypothetical protein